MKKRVFLDTSWIVAAFHSRHEKHRECLALFQEVVKKEHRGFVAAHSLAEIFSVLTRLPGDNRVGPEMAAEMVDTNIPKSFDVIALDGEDYQEVIRRLSSNMLGGGVVYDGLILKAAEKAKVQAFYTLNAKHFRSIPSSLSSVIYEAS